MEAVIATGGKQYRVAPGQVIKVERLGVAKGGSVAFDKVLLLNNEGHGDGGADGVVRCPGYRRGGRRAKRRKVLVVKFKRRKNYRRHRGHRQTMTTVRITGIEV
jgi:large subunit ribosomal protein L21